MDPRDWIALSAVAATIVIALGSLLYASLTQVRQQRREDALRSDHQAREDEMRRDQRNREDELRERHREDSPHIEFGIECRVFDRKDEEYLVEFILVADNKGLVQWKFTSILLRVRGIGRDQPLAYWHEHEPRLVFPTKVIDNAEVIPHSYNFLFVEPEVRQTITFVTKIPVSIEYILVHVEFQYDQWTPHTAERVFQLKSP